VRITRRTNSQSAHVLVNFLIKITKKRRSPPAFLLSASLFFLLAKGDKDRRCADGAVAAGIRHSISDSYKVAYNTQHYQINFRGNPMSTKRKQNGRIFISYRRADARGVAGRLGDSLGQYFGDNRVFRDIEDIAGGADFGDVIQQNLANADAVIVLMGQDWLSITDSEGRRRLDDPNDWVAEEISVAIQSGIPIFPVLIENTPMPREEELPEKLKPLLRYNALSISDNRWKFDVLRLGKIISFDIPSASEKILDRVRAGISFALFASLTYVAATISWNFLQGKAELLQLWQSGAPFVAIVSSILLLASIVNLVDKDKQRYIYASIITGGLGSLIFFISLVFLERSQEPMFIFFGATLVTTLIFAFMNMSGFKAK
jgi:hypothetical protein